MSFNKINTKQEKQTEYFNYYKEKILNENPNSDRLHNFLKSEFLLISEEQRQIPRGLDTSSARVYVEQVLSKNQTPRINQSEIEKPFDADLLSQKRKSSFKTSENNGIPSIKILNATRKNSTGNNEISEEHTNTPNKFATQDLEMDFLKQTENVQLNTSNLTLSSCSSASMHLTNSLVAGSANFKGRAKLNSRESESNTILLKHYSRTLSESSAESNQTCNSVIVSSKNHHNTINSTTSKTGIFKRSLINNLRRLTNEKLILTSNNSPIGIFSRNIFWRF